MKCKGAEVEFKSSVATYWVEKSGVKNHTERLITEEEARWLNSHKVATIRIRNSGDPTLDFTRKATNIYKEGDILRHYLYSFTWEHEEGQK